MFVAFFQLACVMVTLKKCLWGFATTSRKCFLYPLKPAQFRMHVSSDDHHICVGLRQLNRPNIKVQIAEYVDFHGKQRPTFDENAFLLLAGECKTFATISTVRRIAKMK
jgi:hypothetical protein